VRTPEVLEVAARLAVELLEPAAEEVDATGRLPVGHLDALAAAGLYGVSGPAEAGGLGADRATALRVSEILAAGCLGTAFVWVQHQGVVRAVAASTAPGVRDRWLGPLWSGQVRSGVAIAGIRPGTDPLRAQPDGDGWVLTGAVPWVTGWGLVDVVHVAARSSDDGDVVWLLVDAAAAPTITVGRLDLTAVQASSTVTLTFADHRVPGDRLTARTTYGEWQAADVGSLRGNGSLALGLALRCAGAVDDADVRRRVDEVRAQLDLADHSGDAAALAEARAAASALAWTAAARLTVATGGRAVLVGDPAGRAVREAAFLLVFGSRPPIRAALRSRLDV
jgi:alkylation response protein AidB-like acyl-CoA dehydrogenase